jgi:hypothetical protein
MVVVLVIVARTATLAKAAEAMFRRNGRAANMASIVADERLGSRFGGIRNVRG